MTVDANTVCPWCETEHDAASGITRKGERGPEPVPKDGDATMCVDCGEFAIFDHTAAGRLRKPTDDEARELAGDFRAQMMRASFPKFSHRRH